jgi:rod shape-determining protein MreC
MRRGFFNEFKSGGPSHKGGGAFAGAALDSSFYVFISLIIISIFLLMFSGGNLIFHAKNTGLSLFSGVRGGIHEFSSLIKRTVLSIRELADLRKEYAELLKRSERSEELERSISEIYQENNRLREQLGFAQTMRYRRIPAQISGRDPNNLFSAVVINKGGFAGVTRDMTVVALQNGTMALVGKVIQTGAMESLVMPVFDNNAHVSSRLSVMRYEGIVEGQGSQDTPLLMRLVPKRARDEINIGDIVVSSGMGGVFPEGINIGRVSGIFAPEYETTLEIEILPMIDFSRLEYVFLIEKETPVSETSVSETAINTGLMDD